MHISKGVYLEIISNLKSNDDSLELLRKMGGKNSTKYLFSTIGSLLLLHIWASNENSTT